MTYRPGIGPRLARELRTEDGPPRIVCDACGEVHVIRPRRAPPEWFVRGKAPPGWRMERTDDESGVTRRDLCPACLRR